MSLDQNFIFNNVVDHKKTHFEGLGILRKKWTVIVLMTFKNNKKTTFKNLQDNFSISPSILSSTLKELTVQGLISRKAYGTVFPMKVEYQITSHGKKLIVGLSYLIGLISENKKFE